MNYQVLQNFLIAIAIGALIGIQREFIIQKRENYGGLRTFILISFLGALSTFFWQYLEINIILIASFLSLSALILMAYFLLGSKGYYGIITEISSLITFLLGSMVMVGESKLAIVLAVFIVALLTFKKTWRKFIKQTSKTEWHDTVKFALISFLFLPIIPNQTIDPWNLINPHYIWMLVVFISGVEFIGYFLTKIIGYTKGTSLSGFLGGLVSSTAVTSSMANQSKKTKSFPGPYVIASIIANSTMFFRVIGEVALIYFALTKNVLIPVLSMAIVLLAAGYIFSFQKEKSPPPEDKVLMGLKTPFNFAPALKMAILFTIINVISKVAQLLWGNTGIYLTSIISGIADVDAITISLSNLASCGSISSQTATIGIILAVIINTSVKAFISLFYGSKTYGRRILPPFILSIIVGILAIFFQLYLL